MTHRIGRKFAQHSYPEPRRGGIGGGAGGSNYASGPDTQTDLNNTILMEWSDIASGAPAGTDVPVTPISTGRLLIEGVISIKNVTDDTSAFVTLEIAVDGVLLTIPAVERMTCPATGYIAIPFLVETEPLTLAPHDVSIQLTPSVGDVLAIATSSSTISVSEVAAPTG